MEVVQPAAKMLVELSKSQDIVAGDGTTTGTSWFAERLTPLADTDFNAAVSFTRRMLNQNGLGR